MSRDEFMRFLKTKVFILIAQCSTGLPWLCPIFLLLRMVPYAKQHKPVFNAWKLVRFSQWAPQVATNDPSQTPQAPLPQTFPLCHKGSGKTFKSKKVKLNPPRRRFSEAPPFLRTLHLLFPPVQQATLRQHSWSSPRCAQRIWVVWIVMPRWPLIINVKLMKVTVPGKTLRTNRTCTQHWMWKGLIGPTSLQTVSEIGTGFRRV